MRSRANLFIDPFTLIKVEPIRRHMPLNYT
jgi:hypothetical protein